jgi:hypothetical protein
LVWEALERLWYGISLRDALEMTGADLEAYFKAKRKKSIYIPAFDKNLDIREYQMLVKFDLDLTLRNTRLELIAYEKS